MVDAVGSVAQLKSLTEFVRHGFRYAVDALGGAAIDHGSPHIAANRGLDGFWEVCFGLAMGKSSHNSSTWTFGSDPVSVNFSLAVRTPLVARSYQRMVSI